MAGKGKALVTGGAGFMGSHVAAELLKKKYEVVVLDDLSGGFVENVPEGAEFVEGSILDEALIAEQFEKHKFDYTFHLAAYAAEGLSHFIKKFNYENNVIGSIHLLNASIRSEVKCFVFTSSIAVYGTNRLPMTEDLEPAPDDSYGIAKLTVERELKISYDMFGLRYIVFRPHNVYGERQNLGDKYRNVIGIFMNRIMQGKPVPIFGDGEQSRAFSYIGDVAPIIAGSVENERCYNQIFNIGADQSYTINELVRAVGRVWGADPVVEYCEPRNEVKHAYSDHGKVREYFGEQESVSLEEGLKRMAEWAKEAGVRKTKEFDKIEILRNLPPSWLKREGVE